jgi:hypothetical protein
MIITRFGRASSAGRNADFAVMSHPATLSLLTNRPSDKTLLVLPGAFFSRRATLPTVIY